MTKVACVGSGAWGANLVRNFGTMGALHMVCDSDPAALKRAAKIFPDVQVVKSYERVLADSQIRAVVLATPAKTHAALARQALLAGKDVFVEKPLALTLADGRDLVELAARERRILMVGHVLRYHPAVVALDGLIARGELGKLQYVYSNRLNIGKFRREENILWSFAPHDISTLVHLVGQTPTAVQASGGTYLQTGVPDVTMTHLEFPNGVRGHIFVSWLHPVKEQRLVVIGDRKMAVFDDLAKDKLVLYPHEVSWVDRAPVAHRGEAETVTVEVEEPLAVECRHFLDCVERRVTPRTDGQEALRVLEVLQASQQSLDQRGQVVSLARPATGESIPGTDSAQSVYWAHPSAVVDQPCEIGSGTKLWHFSHVLTGSHVGRNCIVGQNVVIGPRVSIGDGVKIQNNVSVYEGVTLEDSVFCGPSMVFTNVINPRSAIPRKTELRPTLVREGATLGANCTIVCGITIGRSAFVGAGAVVTKSVPDYALVVGNPARRVGWICACGIKLKVTGGLALCQSCGTRYRITAREGCRRME
jgi:UDP-2-acetamido-3-amino-2,3-dideoxy-glucuronate N-acetyltransferase